MAVVNVGLLSMLAGVVLRWALGVASAKVTFQADSAYVAGTGEAYVVTSSPGGLTCSVPNVTTTLTGSQSCVVSGLTTDTAYTFTVAESGGTTVDTVSAPSNSVTPVSGLLPVSQYANFATSFSSGAGGLILPVAVACARVGSRCGC